MIRALGYVSLLFAFPVGAFVLALAWRHPVGALSIVGVIVAAIAFATYEAVRKDLEPAKAMADSDDAAAAEAARLHALHAWRPEADIIAKWPESKPVAKYVRDPSGVGLKLNRD